MLLGSIRCGLPGGSFWQPTGILGQRRIPPVIPHAMAEARMHKRHRADPLSIHGFETRMNQVLSEHGGGFRIGAVEQYTNAMQCMRDQLKPASMHTMSTSYCIETPLWVATFPSGEVLVQSATHICNPSELANLVLYYNDKANIHKLTNFEGNTKSIRPPEAEKLLCAVIRPTGVQIREGLDDWFTRQQIHNYNKHCPDEFERVVISALLESVPHAPPELAELLVPHLSMPHYLPRVTKETVTTNNRVGKTTRIEYTLKK